MPALATKTATSVLPGAVTVGAVENNNLVVSDSVQAAITAHAGGGQANAVVITARQFQISVCATLHDSVKLPPALAGMVIMGANDGAAGADVYPATGEQINGAGANVIFALANTKRVLFFCVANGFWNAILTA